MTQTQFARAVVIAHRNYPDQRAGQILYNVLFGRRPDIAEQIQGTDNDPFYDDKKIAGCWERIITLW